MIKIMENIMNKTEHSFSDWKAFEEYDKNKKSDFIKKYIKCPETEFLFRLLFCNRLKTFPNERQKVIQRRQKYLVSQRCWLVQERRNISIENVACQNEEWIFEIDWNILNEMANACGINLRQGEKIPIPLLSIRRFVATDYNCEDPEVYMSHRHMNTVFASLLVAYYVEKCSDSEILNLESGKELSSVFKAWYEMCRIGGNYPRNKNEIICKQEKARKNAIRLCIPYLIGNQSLYSNNDIIKEFSSFLEEEGYSNVKTVEDIPADCIHEASSKDYMRTVSVLILDSISKYLMREYPVLAFIPVQRSGRKTYCFTVTRHGDENSNSKQAWVNKHNELSFHKHAEYGNAKKHWYDKWESLIPSFLLFREVNRSHELLRGSALTALTFAKDIKPCWVRDYLIEGGVIEEFSETSIESEDELYSSLHFEASGDTEYDDNHIKPIDRDVDQIRTRCWLIPKFRYIARMFFFLSIQFIILVLYFYVTSGLSAWPVANDDTVKGFLTLTWAQIGVYFFIANRDESSVLTQMLRIPRYAIALLAMIDALFVTYIYLYGNKKSEKSWSSPVGRIYDKLNLPTLASNFIKSLRVNFINNFTFYIVCSIWIVTLIVVAIFCMCRLGPITIFTVSLGFFGVSFFVLCCKRFFIAFPFCFSIAVSFFLIVWLAVYLFLHFTNSFRGSSFNRWLMSSCQRVWLAVYCFYMIYVWPPIFEDII